MDEKLDGMNEMVWCSKRDVSMGKTEKNEFSGDIASFLS